MTQPAVGDAHTADRPGPRGSTEIELRAAVSTRWAVDDIRPAKVYGNDSALDAAALVNLDHDNDNDGHFMVPGFLLRAHKSAR